MYTKDIMLINVLYVASKLYQLNYLKTCETCKQHYLRSEYEGT